MVYLFSTVFCVFHNWSHEKKKKSLVRLRLKRVKGIRTGPPTVPPDLVAVPGLGYAKLIVEEFVGVEFLVPIVIVGAAMELRRSVLDGDVQLAAVARAIFGGVVAREQFHFTDCVHAGSLVECSYRERRCLAPPCRRT